MRIHDKGMELTSFKANIIVFDQPFDYKKSNRSDPPEPRNSSYNDVWDDDHVKMPCSAKYIEVRNSTVFIHLS